MTEYTPTTTQVRDAYVRAMRNAFIASASEHEAEFDRWLDTVQYFAWSDGAWDHERHGYIPPNPYKQPHDDNWLETPVRVERPQEEDDA